MNGKAIHIYIQYTYFTDIYRLASILSYLLLFIVCKSICVLSKTLTWHTISMATKFSTHVDQQNEMAKSDQGLERNGAGLFTYIWIVYGSKCRYTHII